MTPRLRLPALPLPVLRALVTGEVAAAAELVDFPLDSSTFAGDEHVLSLRYAQLQVDPTHEPWLLRAAVLQETGRVVGKGGFHAPPDRDGTVEIGYRIAAEARGRGLATELATGLLHWASEQGAARCLASIRPDNLASLALARRLDFARTGEQIDEIDGLEWIFTRELDGTLPPYEAPR